MNRLGRLSCVFLLGVGWSTANAWAGSAATTDPDGPMRAAGSVDDLTQLSLEDLMNVEVTSVSKQRQKLSEAPAAVSVISQEDIRRSGMGSIPELLRLVPGLSVAQFNANRWAITSRGFSDIYANKLLVLMDGRTLYNPFNSGVDWDEVDYLLPDLERIEVIRGPGATLWGANAVNGVINITSKSADKTQGWLFDTRVGTEESASSVRYGGRMDEQTFYRVYGKARYYDDAATADGGDANDNWASALGGFRIDRQPSPDDILTLDAQVYGERYHETRSNLLFVSPFRQSVTAADEAYVGHVLGRWTHTASPDSGFSLQLFYDRVEHPEASQVTVVDTFDLDFQHRFALTNRHELTYGFGARWTFDDVRPTPLLDADPRHETNYVYSAFVQDKIDLVPDRLQWYLGTKLEYNSLSGFELQPSTRLLWMLDARNTLWGAVTRAVRTPSRYDEDVRQTYATFPTDGSLGVVEKLRNRDLEAENVLSYELGYRVQATPKVSVDVTGFYNEYEDSISYASGEAQFQPGPPARLLIPIIPSNAESAETYGAEVAATWQVTDNWRLISSYSLLRFQLHNAGTDEAAFEGASPQHQFQIRSYINLTPNLELNAQLFLVDDLEFGDVPAYARADVNVTWRPRDGLDLTVGVQNVLDDRHPEFNTDRTTILNSESELSAYAQMVWRF